tara:strand:- start:1038 stop:1295 length:258 start_codon:yes stop_codon:yes gene_type:complete
MDLEFLELEIKAAKADQKFHAEMLIEKLATLDGLQVLDEINANPTTVGKLLKEAHQEVKWYTGRVERDAKLLDVFYTARDITQND